MLYYLGKGTEFKKENCKEYKTIKNVLIAASKDKNLCVWDETGNKIYRIIRCDYDNRKNRKP